MRDHIDVYGPFYFIFGVPIILFFVALMTGCATTYVVCTPSPTANCRVDGFDMSACDEGKPVCR